MTNFERIHSGTKEELIDFLDELNLNSDFEVWTMDFDQEFCKRCPPVGEMCEFSYCEAYGPCRFFPQLQNLPSNKDVLRWWLDREAKK